MSSASESLCPGCGIEPPIEENLCPSCRNDQRILGALAAWVESTALQSTFAVRGVNLTQALAYPLMKSMIEELVRQQATEKP